MGAIATAQEAAAALATVGDQLELARSIVREARATLDEAAELIHEDIHDTEIVVARAFTFIPKPTLNGRDLAASAKLVASVFSQAPVLPGATPPPMALAASVSAMPPPVTGPLSNNHDRARTLFARCIPYLGNGEDDMWLKFSDRRVDALEYGVEAETRLDGAIVHAQHTVLIHRFYQSESPSEEDRMREAWKLREILPSAIEEVDAALESITNMRNAVAAEEEIVRQAIDDAAP
uniref:Uncharacterized protein n=1 Tax=Oryza brachyantha TaxID=4533 RepID=J3LPV3_ORYBR